MILGENKNTGYDVVKWIEKQVYTNNYSPPEMIVHSANPVGCKNMLACIQNIKNLIQRNNNVQQ